ncbi:uncharacterized protein N7483_008152 [Penicillium malachiteum]|uniref:uncharacterized protein n=1 Tax=Penicillium malachiteum TaxID=1324776 RepID=UPI002546B953|nr:uncharacterized protein N7483_008152 [Penicillium malachiteum]KAJ5720218.1 hypothetical protein N7483_008152 [Penicillium malachiteum]
MYYSFLFLKHECKLHVGLYRSASVFIEPITLSYQAGELLTNIWDSTSGHERTHVREECENVIRILRSLSIYVPDTGKHNVLYDRATGAVTMLDFGTAIPCAASEHIPYIELLSLFGDRVMCGHESGG